MTDMERRRLQLYAKSARLQNLRRQIEALELVLGPLYQERERVERHALMASVTRRARKKR